MTRATLAAPLALLVCAGCSFQGGSPGAVTATPPLDPTPLARCKIAAGQLELEGLDPRSVAADASCAGVTHVVSA